MGRVNYLIMQAKHENYKIAILTASEAGKYIYKKIGFKDICLFQEFILQK